jgi:hypothetical protein
MKNPLTPSGIDLATFRFVAQCLNHCATARPPDVGKREQKSTLYQLNGILTVTNENTVKILVFYCFSVLRVLTNVYTILITN